MARARADRDLNLFQIPARVPEGFIYRTNFVSEIEEQDLIKQIQKVSLTSFKYYQFTGKRRTASFGWQYEFESDEITRALTIPEFILPLRARAGKLFGVDADTLAQASIVEYPVGAPIGWHRDIPQFGVIIGISLGAACRMRFRKYQRVRSKVVGREETLSIELQPRSVYLMSGASRALWQHSIPPVKELRYSIVMRSLHSKQNKAAVADC